MPISFKRVRPWAQAGQACLVAARVLSRRGQIFTLDTPRYHPACDSAQGVFKNAGIFSTGSGHDIEMSRGGKDKLDVMFVCFRISFVSPVFHAVVGFFLCHLEDLARELHAVKLLERINRSSMVVLRRCLVRVGLFITAGGPCGMLQGRNISSAIAMLASWPVLQL
jgi:hypothetical protein